MREEREDGKRGKMRISSYHGEFFVSLPRSALLLTTRPLLLFSAYPSFSPPHPPTVHSSSQVRLLRSTINYLARDAPAPANSICRNTRASKTAFSLSIYLSFFLSFSVSQRRLRDLESLSYNKIAVEKRKGKKDTFAQSERISRSRVTIATHGPFFSRLFSICFT